MKKFYIYETPKVLKRMSDGNLLYEGSLSLFGRTRIPVTGDYLYLGEDMGTYKADYVIFEMIDNGNVVIAVTKVEVNI